MVFKFQNKQAVCGIKLLSKMRIFIMLTTVVTLIFSMAGKFPPCPISAQTTLSVRTAPPAFDLPYRPCWSYPTEQPSAEYLASDNVEAVYISNLTGGLTAININDGEKVWHTELGGSVISNILLDVETRNLYVVTKKINLDDHLETQHKDKKNSGSESEGKDENTSDSLKLWSLSKGSGLTNWQIILDHNLPNTPGANNQAYLLSSGQNLILNTSGGKMLSVNKNSGSINWTAETGGNSTVGSSFSHSRIYTPGKSNDILEISAADGKITRRIQSSFSYTLIHIGDEEENLLVLGDKKGEVSARDMRSGKKIWKLRTGGEISSIVSSQRGLLISSDDNFIYLVSPTDGRIIWKRRMEGRSAGDPLVINNLVVVSAIGTSQASLLELSNGKLFSKISLAEENYFSGSARYIKGIIIFPTLKGIFGFSQTSAPCPLKEKAE